MHEKDINEHWKCLNKAIKYVHDHKTSFYIPKLNLNSLRISAYIDPAFTNNVNLSSQIGRIVPLTNDNVNSISVSDKSYQSIRVTYSVLSAEVIAFAELFDDALAIRKLLDFVYR